MRLKLDTDGLNDDFFHHTRLLGIIAPLKAFQFCWKINQIELFNFRLNPEIEIQLFKKGRHYSFSVYESNDLKDSTVMHYLYHNCFEGEYLLPEFKHFDFLWLMKGSNIKEDATAWTLSALKQISGVQLVTELTNEQIKNKENMIF